MGAAPSRGAALAIAVILGSAFSSQESVAEPLRLFVESASAEPDMRTGETVVAIHLKYYSRQHFARFSVANVGQVIDVRVDGESVCKPIIREPLTGGTLMIPVKRPEEALLLAARLNNWTAALEVEAGPK